MATATLINQVISRSSLPPVNQSISGSCGTFSTGSTAYVPVTGLSLSFTTSGRPLRIFLTTDGTDFASGAIGAFFGAGATGYKTNVRALRDAVSLGGFEQFHGTSGGAFDTTFNVPCAGFQWNDQPAAGTYTYSVQIAAGFGAHTATATRCRLVVVEVD